MKRRHTLAAAALALAAWGAQAQGSDTLRIVVGYRGSGPLASDLMGGQVPVAFDTFDTLVPQHAAGKLRILAMSGAKRSTLAPDVPTFREAGMDLVATGWNAFFAPATMPADKVDRYATAIRDVMRDPDTQRKFADANLTPVVSTRAETQAMLKKFAGQWGPVVRQSGYQP
jgi:tripartite-type tricarboxylate transporter receptor subunit TctC